MTPRGRRAGSAGFTLIETIAVVAIFALLVAVVAPNLGRLSGRRLRAAADDLAARLELARQRTIVTGIPHRLWIDLEAASYRLEWLVGEAEARGEASEPVRPAELDLRGQTPLALEAPRDETRAFRPLPGLLGRDEVLADSLAFRGVETPAGFSEAGEVAIEFAPDGSADSTSVILDDESGRALAIDVLPLAETVRVGDVES
jgi:prepilin-type N-terminal cleavage/methylation domain-containing protein